MYCVEFHFEECANFFKLFHVILWILRIMHEPTNVCLDSLTLASIDNCKKQKKSHIRLKFFFKFETKNTGQPLTWKSLESRFEGFIDRKSGNMAYRVSRLLRFLQYLVDRRPLDSNWWILHADMTWSITSEEIKDVRLIYISWFKSAQF